jgi:hypothetical protein
LHEKETNEFEKWEALVFDPNEGAMSINSIHLLSNFVFKFTNVYLEFKTEIRYLIWQYELSPSDDSKHVQAYVELFRIFTASMVKTLFGINDLHVEKRNWTSASCINYCSRADKHFPGETSMQHKL